MVKNLHWLSVLDRSNLLRSLNVFLYRPRCPLQFVVVYYWHLNFVIGFIYCLCF